MGNQTGTNLWFMGWMFFVGYAVANDMALVWWHWIISIFAWPAMLAAALVGTGAL